MGKNSANKGNRTGGAAPATGDARTQGFLSSFPGRLLLAVCVLQFVVLAKLTFWHPDKPVLQALARTSTAGQATEPVFRGKSGPWGELEYVRINLEPPEEFVPVEDGRLERALWFFEGYSSAQLSNLLSQCDLSASQRATLLNATVWAEEANGITVIPGEEIVLGLSPPARAQIYSVLGESPRNRLQCWPFRFRRGGFDDWFDQRDFSPATMTLVKSLVYERGGILCFSDVMEALSRIPAPAERRQLVKTLAGSSALLMKLRVRPDSDIQALTAYWGRGFHTKDLEPLFRSLTKVRGSVTIDVAQLLPPLPRKKLNTFPVPSDAPTSNQPPNCSWTVMNFFNDPPDERFRDAEVMKKELETNYRPVADPTFGDLLLLLKPGDDDPGEKPRL